MKDTLAPKKLVKVKIDKRFERDFGNTNLKIWRVHNDKELVEKTFEKLKEKLGGEELSLYEDKVHFPSSCYRIPTDRKHYNVFFSGGYDSLSLAIRHLEKGRVVIFAGGTGTPFFTTDTASALRASEIDANVMLMAKNGVDGVYTDDPNVNKDAKKLENIDYDEIIKHDLKVMDRSACDLCQQNNIPIIVFDFKAKDAIKKIILGEKIGTYVGKQ